jgi:hypothetical protein
VPHAIASIITNPNGSGQSMGNKSARASPRNAVLLRSLISPSGRVQERLGDAAIFLIRVRPEDISDENLRRIFIGVMDDLSYAQSQGGDEGNIRATKRLTDDEDARSIARRILELYHGLDRFLRER